MSLRKLVTRTRPIGPDFIGVGAPRSGTSWVYEVLSRHSYLWLPPIKELHYFDAPTGNKRWLSYLRMRLASGLGFGRPLSQFDVQYFFGRRSDDWYCNLFEPARTRGFVTGEITPAYSTIDIGALRRLRALNPNVKLFFIMRDPVMRSWSAVMKLQRNLGLKGTPDTKAAIEYALSEGVRQRTAYLDNIERLERVFPGDQIFYGFFDHLVDEPKTFVAQLLNFLAVEPGNVGLLIPAVPINVAAGNREPPLEFARMLAADYLPWVKQLCQRFDGPPQYWRARYECLLSGGNAQATRDV